MPTAKSLQQSNYDFLQEILGNKGLSFRSFAKSLIFPEIDGMRKLVSEYIDRYYDMEYDPIKTVRQDKIIRLISFIRELSSDLDSFCGGKCEKDRS